MSADWKSVAEGARRPLVIFATCTFFAVGIYLVAGAPGLPVGQASRDALKLLGAFLAAKIGLDFLYRALIRPIDDRKLQDRLGELWDEKIDRYLLRSSRYGFAGFEDTISPAALFGDRRGGETVWWLDTFDPQYRTWTKELRAALERGVDVVMFIMDPNSPLADHRADEIRDVFDRATFRRELAEFAQAMEACRPGRGAPRAGSLDIIRYTSLPCAPVYLVEHDKEPTEAWTSYFLGSPTGLGFPHLKWTRGGADSFILHLHRYLRAKRELHPGPGKTRGGAPKG